MIFWVLLICLIFLGLYDLDLNMCVCVCVCVCFNTVFSSLFLKFC